MFGKILYASGLPQRGHEKAMHSAARSRMLRTLLLKVHTGVLFPPHVEHGKSGLWLRLYRIAEVPRLSDRLRVHTAAHFFKLSRW